MVTSRMYREARSLPLDSASPASRVRWVSDMLRMFVSSNGTPLAKRGDSAEVSNLSYRLRRDAHEASRSNDPSISVRSVSPRHRARAMSASQEWAPTDGSGRLGKISRKTMHGCVSDFLGFFS